MDQSFQDEITRLKRVISEQAEVLSRQEAVINRQLEALEEMVQMRKTIDGQTHRIRELQQALTPWNSLKRWCRNIFTGTRTSGE
ncbi:MAG TPA: hypothetical protein PLV45_13620 [bacterium]|nr:hypothetical protein [bacterium]